MAQLSKADMYALMDAWSVEPELAQIMCGGAWAESRWDTHAVGDNGHSIGLFQLHDQGMGAGLTVAQRHDPNVQMERMLPEYRRYWEQWRAQGYTGADLAWRTCAYAEKPWDYENPDSAAAQGYRDGWHHAAREVPMGDHEFVLGFADLAAKLGAEVVGVPTTDEYQCGPVTRQLTSTGELVYAEGGQPLFLPGRR